MRMSFQHFFDTIVTIRKRRCRIYTGVFGHTFGAKAYPKGAGIPGKTVMKNQIIINIKRVIRNWRGFFTRFFFLQLKRPRLYNIYEPLAPLFQSAFANNLGLVELCVSFLFFPSPPKRRYARRRERFSWARVWRPRRQRHGAPYKFL